MLKDWRTTTIENRRILVIDDNLAIHEDYRKVLAAATAPDELDQAGASLFDEAPVVVHGESFELRFADQGETGFHMVKQALAAGTPYALAFVDMRMPPGWDGLQTIEEIGKADPDIQVVVCTAFSDHPWHEIATRLGKTDRLLILRKPFDAVEVERLAASLTCKWELTQRAKLQIACLNALVDLRYKELQDANARLAEVVAARTAELSKRNLVDLRHKELQDANARLAEDVAARNAELSKRNEGLQQILKQLFEVINTAKRANAA